MISTFSYNAERVKDPELAERYFRKGLGSLKVLNYRDALLFFARSYSIAPKSYYGELSYLYLGKSYALYSYAFGSKKGVMASIGYLNQYPFHYKVPRFIHTQREFVADSYLLLQWYGTAKNIYANLYGETEKVEYMLKFGYASALEGGIEGFKYIRSLSEIPSDYLDLYYMTMGFYNFNLGRYSQSVAMLLRAIEINSYLREDAHLLFRVGVSYFKIGDWRRALLYLELTPRNDPFKVYYDMVNFYLAHINLEMKNFREAFENVRRLTENDKLFYLKISQLLFSGLWYYEEFLDVYGDKLGNYRGKLLQIGWLNVENIYGELPALGIYYLALKDRNLSTEEKEFLRVKKITLREFVLQNDLFVFDRFVSKNREALGLISPYSKEEASFLRELYRTNEENFLKLFGDQKGVLKLVRALVFLGDAEAKKLLPYVKDESLSKFLLAKLKLLEGKVNDAVGLIKDSLADLKGEDRLEAEILLGYLTDNVELLEKHLPVLTKKEGRLAPYLPMVLVKLGDTYYDKGKLDTSLTYYKKALEVTSGEQRWWVMFRVALLSEKVGDENTLKQVVNEAKEEDNIWSRAIRALWEG